MTLANIINTPTTDCDASGFMMKNGRGPLRNAWKSRFFEVKGAHFTYFNDDDPSIRTELGRGICKKVERGKKENGLILTCKEGRRFNLRCASQAHCQYWMEAFTTACWNFFNSQIEEDVHRDRRAVPKKRASIFGSMCRAKITTFKNPQSYQNAATDDDHPLEHAKPEAKVTSRKTRRATFATLATKLHHHCPKSDQKHGEIRDGPWNDTSMISLDKNLSEKCGGVLQNKRRRNNSMMSSMTHGLFGPVPPTKPANHHLAPVCTNSKPFEVENADKLECIAGFKIEESIPSPVEDVFDVPMTKQFLV
jgi:hypothetical protein